MNIKKELIHSSFLDMINSKILKCREILAMIDESSQEESKSTAGDKYETSREMFQQESNKILNQLDLLIHQKNQFVLLDPIKTNYVVSPGALVLTNIGSYYISIALGKLSKDNIPLIYAISPESPMAISLWGMKAGNQTKLNDRTIIINNIY